MPLALTPRRRRPNHPRAMDADAFLHELDEAVRARLARLGRDAAAAEPGPDWSIACLLGLALKKELEAAEEAAMWIPSETDAEVKLALMRQCGDEAKHYRHIEARLRELGATPPDPLGDGRTPMFAYLTSLTTTVERIAAGPFAREALAQVHNDVFIAYCEAKGDVETARLYREIIQPDEKHHHELGRRLLRKVVRNDADRERARRAAARTLELAEELQELARLKKGIARAPGC